MNTKKLNLLLSEPSLGISSYRSERYRFNKLSEYVLSHEKLNFFGKSKNFIELNNFKELQRSDGKVQENEIGIVVNFIKGTDRFRNLLRSSFYYDDYSAKLTIFCENEVFNQLHLLSKKIDSIVVEISNGVNEEVGLRKLNENSYGIYSWSVDIKI